MIGEKKAGGILSSIGEWAAKIVRLPEICSVGQLPRVQLRIQRDETQFRDEFFNVNWLTLLEHAKAVLLACRPE